MDRATSTALTQSVNTVAERQQRAVNVRALHHALARVMRVRRTLATSQINQIQAPVTHFLFDAAHALTLFDVDLQDGVRSRRVFVRRCRLRRPLKIALLQDVHYLKIQQHLVLV